MQLIEIDKIIIKPNRQRQEFDQKALEELTASLRKRMMHPVVLREETEGMSLVAGERRLRVITDMHMLGEPLYFNDQRVPEGFVPYTTLGQLSELEAEEAELEENLHRKDLTWQEQAAAMSRLHKLRSTQAQAAGRIHTVADTALEVKGRSDGSYQDSVRKDIIVAKYLHDPEIAKAKTVEEAFKALKRQETTQKNIQLAQAVGKTYSTSLHKAYNVNCLDWMESCEAGVFDVILTDPPYGMGADSFGDGGGGRLANSEHHYKDDYAHWKNLMFSWAKLSFRVTKPEAHAYVFCDLDNFHELKKMMQDAGWYVFRTPMICTKPNSGRVPLPDEGPRRQWEMLLYAIKGHKKTTAIYPDVITTFQDAGLQHGAQKPVALYENLLQRSVRPGDKVLDTFAGSGTIFPAATTFKCEAVGLEQSVEYFGICLKRIDDIGKTTAPAGTGDALGDELKQLMGGK